MPTLAYEASTDVVTLTSSGRAERAKAFAVYGAISGGGAAVGLLLGGLLTEYADCRSCLLVNVPIAIFTLAAFVAVEKRSSHPLLPLHIPWDRNRAPGLIGSVVVGSVLIGGTLYLTFYLQVALGMSPFVSGVASLPLTVAITIAARVAAQVSTRVGPKIPMAVGPVVAAAGLVPMLTRIDVDSSYRTVVLPALLVSGFGIGLMIAPMQNVALVGVRDHDAGAASALATPPCRSAAPWAPRCSRRSTSPRSRRTPKRTRPRTRSRSRSPDTCTCSAGPQPFS
ncbi:MFS transporter [Rhodococcus sp. NPDC003318]|uniref:MFS transporter n=1 Tax=Rhodococcus sp. NPDC003318 TaxID=3364503 RepID=UPI0036C05D22